MTVLRIRNSSSKAYIEHYNLPCSPECNKDPESSMKKALLSSTSTQILGLAQLKEVMTGLSSSSQQEQQAVLMALSRTQTIQGQNLLYTLGENRALTWSLRRRSLITLAKTQAFKPVSSAHCKRLQKLAHDSSTLVAQQASKMNNSAACSTAQP